MSEAVHSEGTATSPETSRPAPAPSGHSPADPTPATEPPVSAAPAWVTSGVLATMALALIASIVAQVIKAPAASLSLQVGGVLLHMLIWMGIALVLCAASRRHRQHSLTALAWVMLLEAGLALAVAMYHHRVTDWRVDTLASEWQRGLPRRVLDEPLVDESLESLEQLVVNDERLLWQCDVRLARETAGDRPTRMTAYWVPGWRLGTVIGQATDIRGIWERVHARSYTEEDRTCLAEYVVDREYGRQAAAARNRK